MLLAALQVVEWSQSLGGKNLSFFFFAFFFLLLKITVHEHQKEQKDVRFCFLSFFPFFCFFFFLILNICYIVGGEKKWLSKLRANGEHKKKGGWMSCRQGMDCKQRQIKKKGGEGGRERQP